MSDRQTRFAVSTRFIVWGDHLDHERLADFMRLSGTQVTKEMIGEKKTSKASQTTRTVKTSMLSVLFNDDDNQFAPVEQLSDVADKLNMVSDKTLNDCGVERSELQMFVYYEKGNSKNAEPDFLLPEQLVRALARAKIPMSISVMP